VLTYSDLVALTGGTGAQAIALFTAKAGSGVSLAYARVVTPFTSSDGTLLSIAGIVAMRGARTGC